MSQGHVCKKICCPAYRCCPLVTSLRMKPTHGGGQSRENHTRSSCSCSGDKAEEFGFSQHKEPILQRAARVINTTFFHRTLVSALLALCSAGRTKSAWLRGVRTCSRPLSLACRQPSSPCVFTWFSFCACLYLNLLYKDTCQIRKGPRKQPHFNSVTSLKALSPKTVPL